MAFTEVSSLDTDVTTRLGGVDKKTGKKNPVSAEGYYLGFKKIDSKMNRSGFSYLHILQTPKGNLGVWGKTDMDRKLTTITPGTMVRITFDKIVQVPTGPMYKFKVEADANNTIEVNSAQPTVEAAGTDEDFGSVENEEVQEDVEDATTLLSQQKQLAKVQALLKGNKTK